MLVHVAAGAVRAHERAVACQILQIDRIGAIHVRPLAHVVGRKDPKCGHSYAQAIGTEVSQGAHLEIDPKPLPHGGRNQRESDRQGHKGLGVRLTEIGALPARGDEQQHGRCQPATGDCCESWGNARDPASSGRQGPSADGRLTRRS